MSEAFTHRIRIGWADCDPARVAFTGRIPYFALEAIDAFWEAIVGADWYRLNIDRNVGTPFVHMSFDLRSPITPLHPLLLDVRVLRVGEGSVRFRVEGRQDGVLCFESELVEAFTSLYLKEKARLPDDIRAKLLERLEAQTA